MTDTRCVKFIPFNIVHRAVVALDEEKRKYQIWQDEFEQEHNVRFGQLTNDVDNYCLIFPTEQDYVMFMLKWA